MGCGTNERGELGSFKERSRANFEVIKELSREFVVEVGASNFSAGLTINSSLFTWGYQAGAGINKSDL